MRVRGLLAALAVGSVLVGGCADPQEANDTLPTATSAVEAEPTLAPLGPVDFPVPDEAREKTSEGAQAALRYYLLLITRQAGLDGQPLRDLSQGCALCTFFADQSDSDAAQGVVYTGGDITPVGSTTPALTGDLAEFAFSVNQSAVSAVDASGGQLPDRAVAAVEGVSTSVAMTWSSTSQAWLITSLLFE